MSAVAFSPGGTVLASGSEDNMVRVRDPAAGVLRLLAGHSSGVDAVTLSPAGVLLAFIIDDMTVRPWR